MKIEQMLLYFSLYAFTGWVLEVIYRSWTQRRFVNPGFLFGPFVPIYGVGAVALLFLHGYLAGLHPAVQYLLYTLLLSLIEYITGEICERLFHLKLWDYSDSRFNLGGKISLSFSLAWGVLALALLHLLHPLNAALISGLPEGMPLILTIALGAYFAAAFTLSFISLASFRRNLLLLYEKYLSLSNSDIQRVLGSFRRLLGAFPDLNRYLNTNLNENFRQKASALMEKISGTLGGIVSGRRPAEEEYRQIVADILANSEFQRLKEFFHHNSSIYEHAEIVSYLSYRVCKYLNLDHVSAARGGLLHDFFLYDWRNHDEPDLHRDKFHGIEHPRIALQNSEKHFRLNEVERDIILKHMWPLTLMPPRYRESFVVTFVDKYVASREFLDELRKRRGRAD